MATRKLKKSLKSFNEAYSKTHVDLQDIPMYEFLEKTTKEEMQKKFPNTRIIEMTIVDKGRVIKSYLADIEEKPHPADLLPQRSGKRKNRDVYVLSE